MPRSSGAHPAAVSSAKSRPIRVGDAGIAERFAGRPDLVAGGQHGDHGAAMDAELRDARSGSERDRLRAEPATRLEEGGPPPGRCHARGSSRRRSPVRGRDTRPEGGPWRRGRADRACRPRRVALSPRPGRRRPRRAGSGTGRDAERSPGPTVPVAALPAGTSPVTRAGWGAPRTRRPCRGPDRIAVHRRVVPRRQGDRGDDRLREHAAKAVRGPIVSVSTGP